MKFSCEQCGTRYSIADQKVEGKRLRIRCKVCNFIMDVRGTPKHLIQAQVSRSETTVQAAPDIPPRTDWYVAKGGEPIGPVTFSALANEIKERRLPRDVLVWNETFSDWKSATDVPELARLLPPPVPVPPAQTPESPMGDSAIGVQGAPLADTATEPAQYEAEADDNPVDNVGVDAAPEAAARPVAEPLADTPIEDIADLSLSDVESLSMSGVLDLAADESGSDNEISDNAEALVEPVPAKDESAVDAAPDVEVQEERVSSFSRDNTEMFSLEEIESMSEQREAVDASAADDVEAPVAEIETAEAADEDTAGVEDVSSSVDVVSDDVVSDVEAEAESELQDSSVAQDESSEAAEDKLGGQLDTPEADQDSVSFDGEVSIESESSASPDPDDAVSETGSDDSETPVWLGTDDGLPQFVAPTDTVPLSQASTDDGQDDDVEEATLPPTDGEVLVDAAPSEAGSDIEEPTVDISTEAYDQAGASDREALLRADEPAVSSAEPATPFVMPSAPQPPKSKDSSKSMPAVLIAVVGILLVTFLVLRDDGYGPISPEPATSNTNVVEVTEKTQTEPATTNQQVDKQPEPTKTTSVKPEIEVKPATDTGEQPKKPVQELAGKAPVVPVAPIEPVEPVRQNEVRKTGLLAEELEKPDTQIKSPQSKTAQVPKRRGRLSANSVQVEPAKSKSSKESLLAALSADEDEDELDVTRLGDSESVTATKDKERGKDRAARLMNSANQLEQFEGRKMARRGQPKTRGSRKNRERLLDLPSDSEVDSGSDGFPAEDVSRIFNRERKGINVCYNKHLKKGGRRFRRQLKLIFSVGPSGKATNVSIGSKYERTVMKSCLTKFIGRLKFPPFEGKAQKVEFNLKLSNIY